MVALSNHCPGRIVDDESRSAQYNIKAQLIGRRKLVPPRSHKELSAFGISEKLECGPMPNVMAALPNVGGAVCSTPQSLADAHYYSAVQ